MKLHPVYVSYFLFVFLRIKFRFLLLVQQVKQFSHTGQISIKSYYILG